MLKTVEIIEKLDLIDRDRLSDMIKQINIPDFYKCIAQFSGLRINDIDDEVMFKYIKIWATNKYPYFKLFGNKTQLDIPFEWIDKDRDINGYYRELMNSYPVYAPWLEGFNGMETNTIKERRMGWDTKRYIDRFFPEYKLEGSTITHFFKKYLNAPNDLITRIGAVYENKAVNANFTLSIDPVDIMLASDNPYGWQSCYRLELGRNDSHADGCMAAVLDTSNIISYVWTSHGEFNLYDSFKFKDIRYKRMRMWIALNEDMDTVYFASLYPGRSNYSEEYTENIRNLALAMIAKAKNWSNVWDNIEHNIWRDFGYGYSEYDNGYDSTYTNLQVNPDKEVKDIIVYNVQIKSADGNGVLPGSYCEGSDYKDDCQEYEYNGDGFIADNFFERYWCPYLDDWCEHDCTCEEDCLSMGRDCYEYADAHPYCSITEENDYDGDLQECIHEGRYYPEVEEGTAYACHGDCQGCPMWEKHHSVLGEDDDHPDAIKAREEE